METEQGTRKGKRERSPSAEDSDWDRENERRRKRYRTRSQVKYESPLQKLEHVAGSSTGADGSSSMSMDAELFQNLSSSEPKTQSPLESLPMTESALDSLANTDSIPGSARRSLVMASDQAPSCQPKEEDAKDLAG